MSRPSFVPLLPVLGTSTPVQVRFRSELRSTVQVLTSPSAAPGTTRTCESGPKSTVPRIVEMLWPPVLPVDCEGAFFAFFGSSVWLGRKSASRTTGWPTARWNYVKLVEAAAVFCRVARGSRAAFDGERPPQMGAS